MCCRSCRATIQDQIVRPAAATAIVFEEARLLLTVQGCGVRVGRRVLDRLTRQIDRHRRFEPAHALDPLRRNEHLVSEPPIARIDNEIADNPGLVVEVEILYVTDCTVCRTIGMALEIIYAA